MFQKIFKKGDKANFIQKKLVERHAYYQQANYRLTSDQITEEGLKKIISKHAS